MRFDEIILAFIARPDVGHLKAERAPVLVRVKRWRVGRERLAYLPEDEQNREYVYARWDGFDGYDVVSWRETEILIAEERFRLLSRPQPLPRHPDRYVPWLGQNDMGEYVLKLREKRPEEERPRVDPS